MKKALKAFFIVLVAVASVITLVGGHLGFGYSYTMLLSQGVFGSSSQAHELVRRGAQAYRAEEYEEAIGLFQDALRVDPKLRIARSSQGIKPRLSSR